MRNLFYILLSFLLMACGSGRNKVDKAVEACWQARQTGKEATIDFAKAFDFEWDSLRFYSVGCSLEDIDHDLGFPLTEYTDLADRMVFLNHGKPAYVAGWWYDPERPRGTTINCTGSIYKTDRQHARFYIRREGYLYVLCPQRK